MDAVAINSVNDVVETYLIPWGIKALVAVPAPTPDAA